MTDLHTTSFQLAVAPARRRLIMSLHGKVKQGKTHFALTAPGPIAVQNLDMGLDGVVQKFQGHKRIYVSNYEGIRSADLQSLDPAQVMKKMEETWIRFVDDYHWALKNCRTVVWDTASEVWELARLTRLGKIGNIKPHHYAMVNMEFRELIREAEAGDTNFILLHRVKKEYVNEQWSGAYERAGFGDVGSWVHLIASAERQDDGFHLCVEACRQNPNLRGADLPELLATFPQLAMLVFAGTSLEDWQ